MVNSFKYFLIEIYDNLIAFFKKIKRNIQGITLKQKIIFSLIFTVIISYLFASYDAYQKNQQLQLKNQISQLIEDNNKQAKLLNDKSKELTKLMDENQKINSLISDFQSSYQKITNEFLSSKKTPKANRSGVNLERSAVGEIKKLSDTLDSLGKMQASNPGLLDEIAKSKNNITEYFKKLPTLWPAHGRITSRFGGRADPFMDYEKFHSGIDIAADEGSNIYASADGVVQSCEYVSGYGNCIVVAHPQGLSTVYGHCSKFTVKQYQRVKKGQVIGKVGSTGRSTGPHLHFEVRIYDTPIDPFIYLQ